MSEKKTVKARANRDFLERIYPDEEVMLTPDRAKMLEEDGVVEILEKPKGGRGKGGSSGKDEEKSKETSKE